MSAEDSTSSSDHQYLMMGSRQKDQSFALAPDHPNHFHIWKTSDVGFNEILRQHIERVLNKSVTEKYIGKVLDAVKYCEYSHDNFSEEFDYEKYLEAQKVCEKHRIWGNFVGEGGDDD